MADSKEEKVAAAAAKPVVAAQSELAKAQAAHAEAASTLADAEVKVAEAKAAFVEAQPPRPRFVYDRDTVLEVEDFKENEDGSANFTVSGVVAQKFTTNVSSPPSSREFKNVRRGSGRTDVGSFFVG